MARGFQTKGLVRDSSPLLYGNNADALFGLQQQQWPTLREMGHEGLVVESYIWDGAAFGGQAERWEKYHLLKSHQWGIPDTLQDPENLISKRP